VEFFVRRRSYIPPQSSESFTPVARGALQRKCACGKESPNGGECGECQQKTEALQRKTTQFAGQDEKIPPIVDDVVNSSGMPLDEATRAFMEPKFGHDFSKVKVHTDAQAAESARAVNAHAFTVGDDVVFGAGKYSPATAEGTALLAHELSHVVQQESSTQPAVATKSISSPSDGAEREADLAARQVMSNEEVHLNQSTEASVQRLDLAEGLGIGAGVVGAGLIGLGIAYAAGAFDKTTFTDAELEAYLASLATKKKPEGSTASDNKARDIVGRWQRGNAKYNINNGFRDANVSISAFELKILLIQEMLSGATLDDDEQAILKILSASAPAERTNMADRIGYDKLYKAFDGDELDQLYALLPQMASFYPRGPKEHNSYTVDQYIDKWEKEHGETMTPAEKGTLGRGCIGITAVNLFTLGNPDLSNCYDTFAQVWDAARKMSSFLTGAFPDRKALIFSKRFYSGGKDYKPDPKTGKVDMSGYNYEAKPGFTNFDYGLYDETTGKWWHANHCDTTLVSNPDCGGAMEVYESNLQHYSRPLADFDRQIFCVGVAIKP